MREKHPVVELADKVEAAKGRDYNVGPVRREDYWPFGLVSHAHMVHWEATRIVSLAGNADLGEEYLSKLLEHLGDLVNYCKFMWDAVEWEKESKQRRQE